MSGIECGTLVVMFNEEFQTILVKCGDAITSAESCDFEQVTSLPRSAGVYMISMAQVPVYVGKAVTDAGLRGRLAKHRRTLAEATEIDMEAMSFRVLPLNPHLATAVESHLIERGFPWNGSGFGSNRHGIGRASQRASQWSVCYGRGDNA